MNWLDHRFRIGRFASINLYLHWSLALMVAYVAALTYPQGQTAVAMAIAQLAGMFICVTLHEYGHAMAARRYGIATADITLLAIGGIARLRSMPRIPVQELVVAVAGPAVNVVIAGLILVALHFIGPDWNTRLIEVASAAFAIPGSDAAADGSRSLVMLLENIGRPDAIGFLLILLLVNVVLVLFNFIPAFPMDGGRVLRSILAMMMDYRRATYFASRIGWVAAALMAFFAITSPALLPVPLAISVFIVYAGMAEYNTVVATEKVRGVRAAEAVVPMATGVSINSPVAEVSRRFATEVSPTLPLVGIDNIVTGTVHIDQVAQRIAEVGINDAEPIGSWLSHDQSISPVDQDQWLEDVLPGLPRDVHSIPVTDDRGRLIGLLPIAQVKSRKELARQSFDVHG